MDTLVKVLYKSFLDSTDEPLIDRIGFYLINQCIINFRLGQDLDYAQNLSLFVKFLKEYQLESRN